MTVELLARAFRCLLVVFSSSTFRVVKIASSLPEKLIPIFHFRKRIQTSAVESEHHYVRGHRKAYAMCDSRPCLPPRRPVCPGCRGLRS